MMFINTFVLPSLQPKLQKENYSIPETKFTTHMHLPLCYILQCSLHILMNQCLNTLMNVDFIDFGPRPFGNEKQGHACAEMVKNKPKLVLVVPSGTKFYFYKD